MRRHLSVLGLWARCSLYKILGVIAVMCIAEYMLFYFNMKREITVYEATDTFSRPEMLIDRSGVFLCFAAAFIIITLFLIISGCQFSSKVSYTVKRLSINEKRVFLYQCIYNLFIYALFWSVQTILCICMMKHYIAQTPIEFFGEQNIFLAFYRSTRLHALLPLSDGILWVRNALIFVMLGLAAAEFPYLQRNGKKSVTIIALGLYIVALWKQDISPIASLVSTIFVAIVVISSVCYQVLIKEDGGDESEEKDY